MKKTISLLVLAAILCTCVQAQDDSNTNLNPVNIARAFALKTPARFKCYLSGDMLVSNAYQRVTMEFVMGTDFAITNLIINRTNNIPLPEPIFGLPLGDGGFMRNVYLNVSAETRSGQHAGYGYIQRNGVSKDDQLLVTIQPADLRQEIPVDIGTFGSNLRLEIEDFPYGYGYGVSDGMFYVYLPPVGGRYHYILRDSNNVPIGSGWLEPFKEVLTPNDAYVGVRYLGNVVGVEFDNVIGNDDWASLQSVKFDCLIPTTDGRILPGKVIFTDVDRGNLEVTVEGRYWIYVQKVVPEGDMPFLPLVDLSQGEVGWFQTRVATSHPNTGKVVITIIPKPENDQSAPWVGLRRFYGPQQTTPVGGGKD